MYIAHVVNKLKMNYAFQERERESLDRTVNKSCVYKVFNGKKLFVIF